MDLQEATIPLSKCAKLVVQWVLEGKFEAVESAKQIHKKLCNKYNYSWLNYVRKDSK